MKGPLRPGGNRNPFRTKLRSKRIRMTGRGSRGPLTAFPTKVSDSLRRDGLKGATITLKIRLAGFHTYTRSATVSEYTNYFDTIHGEARRLYADFETRGKKVRLVGVKVSKLCPVDFRESLLGADGPDTKKELVHKALDAIR